MQKGLVAFDGPLGRLGNLYLLHRYLVERGDANQAPRAIRILYAKIAHCLVGILHLLQEGNAGAAAMVLRSLFESVVHLQVLLKEDIAFRCQLFEDYLLIEREQIANESTTTPEQRAKNVAQLAKVRSNYHPSQPYSWCWKVVPSKRLRKNIPDNPSLRELCDHIGRPEYYDDLYGRLSGSIHPTPKYEIWMRDGNGHMQLGPNFNPTIEVVANLTTALGAECLVKVIEFLACVDADELCKYVVKVTSAHQEFDNDGVAALSGL